MLQNLTFGIIDIAIIIIYLLFIVGLGLSVGWRNWRKSDGQEYFLANKSLVWPIIGLALFSTNISTIEIVSLAQEGYRSGMLYGNLEWLAIFALITLAILFVPFYVKSNVTTLPEFLEKRFNTNCRRFHVFISLISAIFIHIGFALFAGAKVLEGLFDINVYVGIVLIICLTGLYTIVGGFRAVVLTEAFQTIVLIGGSIILTIIGFTKVGGWSGLTKSVNPSMFTMLRSAEHAPDMPWYSVLLGYPIIGIWYFCTDQTIVQRVLASRDVRHGQLGSIFTGFIKILSVFIFVMPGMICLALINQGMVPATLDDSAETYSFLITHLVPVGVKGLVVAAMLSALMSSIAGALNSIATLFSYDIYRVYKPGVSQRQIVFSGRAATFIGMVVAILWAPQIAKFQSILEGNTAMISYIAPAITAVFLGGVLWKKASSTGAFVTLTSGFLIGVVVFLLDWFSDYTGWNVSSLLMGFYLFLFSSVVLVVVSLLYPQALNTESEKLVWKSYREIFKVNRLVSLFSGLLVAAVIFLYILFS